MEFEEKIKIFASKIKEKLKHIDTEETTKTALILPFLNEVMGYDTTNPAEVKAEYTADLGAKKGEKIDLAILNEGEEIIMIECKSANIELSLDHLSQLYRYFNITDSELGILTNGVIYQIFTDSMKPGQMDKSPFLEINLLDLSERDIAELKKLSKENFDISKIKSKVDDLKYAHDVHKILSAEVDSPSDEFVKVIARQVYDGVVTKNVRDKFYKIIKNEFKEVINEKVEIRLNNALEKNDEDNMINGIESSDDDVVTTNEEYEGYYIIKSIAAKVIDPERVFIRDFKSYCTVIIDDNNRYPLARMYFDNINNMKIELFDKFERDNQGRRITDTYSISNVSEIYSYEKNIIKTVNVYLREIDKKNN
ncbi:MAG: type I restriction enzyme HsdR N-terminal domain-containing protein [Methanobrevibacter sp.]|nr:type I restriction enzyme HsdR N-terminal domain-containing protein [Methanobrevibacter sp.]